MAAKDQGEFREIAAELLYTPLRLRCAHLARLEKLIPELLPDRMYTYEYIFHRITLFNPDSNGMAVFPGRALICGLCGVLRDLTRQAPLEAAGTDGADDEAVLSLRAAAAERGVSPGTVWRWGAAGLPISFYALPDRSRTWGVRRAALKKFLASRPSRAARPSRRITEEQRRALLAEAHELAGQGVPRPEIVRRLAEAVGLPAASIRRLLRQERSPAADADGRLDRGLRRDGAALSKRHAGAGDRPALQPHARLDLSRAPPRADGEGAQLPREVHPEPRLRRAGRGGNLPGRRKAFHLPAGAAAGHARAAGGHSALPGGAVRHPAPLPRTREGAVPQVQLHQVPRGDAAGEDPADRLPHRDARALRGVEGGRRADPADPHPLQPAAGREHRQAPHRPARRALPT